MSTGVIIEYRVSILYITPDVQYELVAAASVPSHVVMILLVLPPITWPACDGARGGVIERICVSCIMHRDTKAQLTAVRVSNSIT